ncbi:MurR/RpiR family transcriptional regulator [Agathobaculum sp. Marseille-P7918]|uniref:MurR/RpiR family transcriptional regulator n=1 Tax=Agathobaculum sp. Marseille-P7918 TaxID=2479843 RepID=UPI000F62C3D4|nr:MurR/RpiR family transcriptional regulator [Agathobaculum sp. Marseille-P7918]
MEKNLYMTLEGMYPSLHRVEKKIAQYVLENSDAVTTMSVQHLARILGVAESSIVRFSKLVGCSGFAEFKLMLVKSAPHERRTIFEELSTEDDAETVVRKVFSRNIDTLEHALELLDYDKIGRAVDLMHHADRIVFFGLGASASIAEDFYIRLMRIGMNAQAVTDAHLSQIEAGLLDRHAVAVGITHTGRTLEVVRALEKARAGGAATIAITGFPQTPVQQAVDLCLELYSPEQLFVSPRVAQISLIDSLYVGLALRRKNSALNHTARMEAALEEFRLK